MGRGEGRDFGIFKNNIICAGNRQDTKACAYLIKGGGVFVDEISILYTRC